MASDKVLKYEEMPSSWRWILDDAYEAQGNYAHIGYEADDADFETLTDMGLLKKVMVQSGLHPKFGYKITPKGIRVVGGKNNTATDELATLRSQVAALTAFVERVAIIADRADKLLALETPEAHDKAVGIVRMEAGQLRTEATALLSSLPKTGEQEEYDGDA